MSVWSTLSASLRNRLETPYEYYQPIDLSPADWALIDAGNFEQFLKLHLAKKLDRICMDRAVMIEKGMRSHFDPQGRSLLDIGCQTGFFSHYFARRGMHATGIDSNSHNTVKGTTLDAQTSVIQTAQRLARQYGVAERCQFRESDIQSALSSLPSFDVVLCLSFLHHLFDVGIGYGVKKPIDVRKLVADIAQKAKHLLYVELDHRIADAHGWKESSLPSILKEMGTFRDVHSIGISIDADKKYRTIYECVR